MLDPFVGSGTTGVVAVPRDRHFVGIELNPRSMDIAERRIIGATTQAAGHYDYEAHSLII